MMDTPMPCRSTCSDTARLHSLQLQHMPGLQCSTAQHICGFRSFNTC